MTRAVIYARCSTEEESQRDALANQVAQAKECIEKKGWMLVDIYVESRSGTSTKGRSQYSRLCEDLSGDRFDVVVAKSQDRLMRNAKDWYLFAERLLKAHKQLYLYLEQKFYSTDDALLTGIRAILAEEYSRELSKKINLAHRSRQKNGGAVILTSNTYGYRKMPDKSVQIIEEEAAVKRRMYELCAAGYGCRRIARILREEGIVGRKGTFFSDSDILRMIKSPINKGTVVMNRVHYDFDTKKSVKIPREGQYVHEDKIPAIVSKELWERANQEIEKRRDSSKRGEGKENQNQAQRGRNRGVSLFSGKLVCGFCRQPYYRCARSTCAGKKIYEWKCRQYLQSGRGQKSVTEENQAKKIGTAQRKGCPNICLEEEKLIQLLGQALKETVSIDAANLSRKMEALSKKALTHRENSAEMEAERKKEEQIRQKMSRLTDKLLEGVVSDAAYREKQQELEEKRKKSAEKRKRLAVESADFPQERFCAIQQFLQNEKQIRRAELAQRLEEIETIVIYPRRMEISFKKKKEPEKEKQKREAENKENFLRISYGSLFQYQRQKEEERENILEQIRRHPETTARQLAAWLGVSASKVRYQMEVLKKEGRISFEGRGGKGRWRTPGTADPDER